jgi:uncharacterized membrane protein
MPYCQSCGAAVEGNFCTKCGTPLGSTVSNPAPASAAAQPAGLSENVASALCYVLGLITGILFLVLAPYSQNRTIRFHAFQSIFYHVGWIIIWMAVHLVLPWGARLFLSPLLGLAAFAGWLYLLIKAYQGQKVMLPVIGDLAAKQA